MQPCLVDHHFDRLWYRDRMSALEAIADTRTAAVDERVRAAKRKLREAQEIALLDVRSASPPADVAVRWRALGCRWLARRLLRVVYRLLEVD